MHYLGLGSKKAQLDDAPFVCGTSRVPHEGPGTKAQRDRPAIATVEGGVVGYEDNIGGCALHISRQNATYRDPAALVFFFACDTSRVPHGLTPKDQQASSSSLRALLNLQHAGSQVPDCSRSTAPAWEVPSLACTASGGRTRAHHHAQSALAPRSSSTWARARPHQRWAASHPHHTSPQRFQRSTS